MQHTVTWFDRLRIERVVWTLDQRLYDLPRRTRIETRREVRQNLLTGARDVGTTQALRNLGDSAELAQEYIFTDAANAFASGITTAHPAATGTCGRR
jgi:hypothetical protein